MIKVRFMHPAIGEFAVPLRAGGETVVGRAGSAADIEITWDRRISRRHAKLWAEGGYVWIQDLGSRNGSWLGNERLSGPVRLEPGSSVIIGETAVIVPEDQAEPNVRDVERTYECVPEELATAVAAAVTEPGMQLGELLGPSRGDTRGDAFTDDLLATNTMDLRPLEESTPAVEAPTRAPRPQLGPGNVVVLDLPRGALERLWDEDLSKGGLYAESTQPPGPGSRVEIRIEGPGGGMTLQASVVSVVRPEQSAAFGMPPGVGLHITDLKGQKKDILEAYVRGRRSHMGGASDLDAAPGSGVEEALARARRLLTEADRDALYKGLDVAANCTQKQLKQALDSLQADFQTALPQANPPQAARLQAAVTVVERLRRILLNAEARLEYDFRAGHVRALERMAAANEKSGPDLATLRRVWNRVSAEQVDEAARLTRKAFAARQEHDLERAVRYGRRALELNPFFEELKKTVDAWERLQRDGTGATPRRRVSEGRGGLSDD